MGAWGVMVGMSGFVGFLADELFELTGVICILWIGRSQLVCGASFLGDGGFSTRFGE